MVNRVEGKRAFACENIYDAFFERSVLNGIERSLWLRKVIIIIGHASKEK